MSKLTVLFGLCNIKFLLTENSEIIKEFNYPYISFEPDVIKQLSDSILKHWEFPKTKLEAKTLIYALNPIEMGEDWEILSMFELLSRSGYADFVYINSFGSYSSSESTIFESVDALSKSDHISNCGIYPYLNTEYTNNLNDTLGMKNQVLFTGESLWNTENLEKKLGIVTNLQFNPGIYDIAIDTNGGLLGMLCDQCVSKSNFNINYIYNPGDLECLITNSDMSKEIMNLKSDQTLFIPLEESSNVNVLLKSSHFNNISLDLTVNKGLLLDTRSSDFKIPVELNLERGF